MKHLMVWGQIHLFLHWKYLWYLYHSFFLEITYHVSNSLFTRYKNTSKNYYLMNPTDTILENQHLFLMKKIIFLGVEDGSIFPDIVGIGVFSVVSVGVHGWVTLSVTVNGMPVSIASVNGAVASVFPDAASVIYVRFSVGSAISVLKQLRLKR